MNSKPGKISTGIAIAPEQEPNSNLFSTSDKLEKKYYKNILGN
ncbi:MAG: hypothetical protein ACRC8A_08520 [Microcoleaceae cyanobacterium]